MFNFHKIKNQVETTFPLFFRTKEYLLRSKKKNAVFIWIPKTAGTSLVKALNVRQYRHIIRAEKIFPNKGKATFGHVDYSQLAEKELISKQFHNTSFKFAFFRNPFDRAVSLYCYLKKIGKLSERHSFLSFCRKLSDEGFHPIGLYNKRGLSQCNPQLEWVRNVNLDFYGHHENLQADFQKLLSKLGEPEIQIPRSNESKYGMEVEDFFCKESKEIVEWIYRDDFAYLNYDKALIIK